MPSSSHLLFLPGAAGQPVFWQPVASLLAAHFPHYRLQHYPAFAGCPEAEDVTDFNSLSDWVIAQVTIPTILIAQSMGGIFAIQAALQKTHLIQGLVLCATSGGLNMTRFAAHDWRQDYQRYFPEAPDWFIRAYTTIEPALEQISIPTLLLWGDADPISPVSVGHYLQQQLAYAELQIIPQGQHDFAVTHSPLVAQHISHFLQKI